MKKALFTLLSCLGVALSLSADCYTSPLYAKLFNGVDFLHSNTHRRYYTNYYEGYYGALGGGYRLDSCYVSRVELEGSFRINNANRIMIDGEGTRIGGNSKRTGVFVNAYKDFYHHSGFIGYVGGGIGYEYVTQKYAIEDIAFKISKNRFGAQCLIGVRRAICYNTEAGIEFRLNSASDKYVDQALGLNLQVGI